ncbi:MAG: helix-turn-helix transcriptional regulator [Bacteroidota bacterium]
MNNNFAINLKFLRKNIGLNQEELAERLGKKKSIISNYESGTTNPGLIVLESIADFFSISFHDLVERELNDADLAEIAKQKSNTKYRSIPAGVLKSLQTELDIYHRRKRNLENYDERALRNFSNENIRLLDKMIEMVEKQDSELHRLYKQRRKLEDLLQKAGF